MRFATTCCTAIGIAVSFALSTSYAADVWFDFEAAPDDTWGNVTNWSGNVTPGTADRANINGDFTARITTDVGTINALRVGLNGNGSNGNGTLILDGNIAALTVNDGGGTGADVNVGLSNLTGTIQIINGGTMTVNNGGNDGQFFLGTTGTGTGILDIGEGTLITRRGLFLGGDSTATDRTNTTGNVTLGDGAGLAGTAIITNSGGNAEIGYGGMGTMTINADGILNQNSNNVVIGQGSASDGTLIINGGQLNIHASGDINFNSGAGLMTLNSGNVTVRDINQNSSSNANNSTINFNGGSVVGRQITNRDGIGTINYNGSQIVLSNGNFDTDFLNIGTAAAGGPVTLNTVAVGAAAGAGDVEVTLAEISGGLTLASGVDATLNINNGSFQVQGGIADGGNVSTINVGTMGSDGEFLIGGASGFNSTRIDSFNVGANGTLAAGYTAFGINTILTTSANLTGGTIADDDTFFPTSNSSNGAASQTNWVGGNAAWDTTASNWSRGLPAGTTITGGTVFTILDSTNAIVGTLIDGTTSDWNFAQTTNQVTLTAASNITSGPVRAYIAGGDVTRATDLRIARDFGADANYLQLTAGSLTIGTPTVGANLIIGTNSGAGDNNGTVLQNAGTVTINGNLQFGVDGLAGDLGGTYDMRGGTLNVTGNVRELTATTNSAQFLINGNAQVNVGGNILVQRFAVADTNVSSITASYTITDGQTVESTGTTAVANGGGARGTLTINDANSSLTALNMSVGNGNNSRGTLNISNGNVIVTQTGNAARFFIGSGSTGSNGISNFNLSGGTFQMTTAETDFEVRSGTVNVNVSGGTLNLNGGGSSDFRLKRSGGTTDGGVATANFSGGTFILGRNFDFGNGNAILNLSGDHSFTVGNDVLMNDSGPGNQFNVIGSSVAIDIGNNFTLAANQTVSFVADGAGISTINITGGSGNVALNGNISFDDTALTTPTTGDAVASETTWASGNGTWTGSDAEWATGDGRMVNPDGAGALQTNDRLTGFQLAAGSVFSGTPTLNLPADWTFDNTTDPLKGDFVYTGANISGLPLHAILDDAGAGSVTIDRTTDLQIAPVSGLDASRMTINDGVTLNISDGTPDGTGPNLILGSASELGDVFHLGGNVVVDGILGYGVSGTPTFGGTYNLDGGTLTVHGDIVEGGTAGANSSVDTAQLYIDGGTLDARGNISLQSFRVGDTAGSTGSYTQNDINQTLTNTGTFYIANNGIGTYTLQAGNMSLGNTNVGAGSQGQGTWNIEGGQVTVTGTTNIGASGTGNVTITGVAAGQQHTFAGVTIGQNNNSTSNGSLTINMANPGDVVRTGRLIVGNNGKGALTFTEGTLNVTSGLDVAETGNANAANGRTATVIIGNGTSTPTLNVSGGNFETANSGTGIVTMNSGTYNQTTNNLIVGQGNGSNATFNMNGGSMNITNNTTAGLIRIGNNNGAVGTFNVNGGSVDARTIDFGGNGNGSTGTYTQSGGNVTTRQDFNVNRGVNNVSTTGGNLTITRNMNLHNSTTDGQSDIEIGGTTRLNVTGNLDYRSGQTDFKVSGSGNVTVGNLLIDGGGTAGTPSTFTVAGNSASVNVGGNMTITGTNQRALVFEALAAVSNPVSTIDVTGTFNVGGTLSLLNWDTTFNSALDLGAIGTTIELVDYGTYGGGFFLDATDGLAWNDGDLWGHRYADGTTFQLFYQGDDMQSGTNLVLVSVIPEPSTYALLGLALGAMVLLRRRVKLRQTEATEAQ